ncbi:vacuolar protein sorting protein VPS34 [Acrasis kona]|uniref:phosphatidylinositol 3-kinase n=1 Tax=Acrasis kona TaxID=1008807 RepID=A0AAW2YPR5_9EUKA
MDFIKDPRTPPSNLTSKREDMYVLCQLIDDDCQLCPSIKTSYRSQHKNKEWTEWIVFPVKISEITPSTVLCLTVYDIFSPQKQVIVGGSTYSLFDDVGVLRMGSHKLKLWEKKSASGRKGGETMGDISIHGSEFARIEQTLHRIHSDPQSNINDQWLNASILKLIQIMDRADDTLYINIEFERYDSKIIFHEFTQAVKRRQKQPSQNILKEYIQDLEIDRENPVAKMHLKLSMHLSHGFLDFFLEPDSNDRKLLNKIIEKTSLEQITPQEKQLFWKYRYWLAKDKKALTKFLRCVDWEIEKENKEAINLLQRWTRIELVDCLELLSKTFANNQVLRSHAANILKDADDDWLLSMLPQLIQSLRYDKQNVESDLADLLISRCANHFNLANYFFWYLRVESINKENSHCGHFEKLSGKFLHFIKKNGGTKILNELIKQQNLVFNLQNICNQLKMIEYRDLKESKLKELLIHANKDTDQKDWSKTFNGRGVFLPIDPHLRAIRINPNDASVFKSNSYPILLCFETEENKKYKVIFKIGDDLRQDQLMIQIIQVMDGLLQKNGMDLKLTPYNVLACSGDVGFVECVTPSVTLESIVTKYVGVRSWFREICKNDERAYEEACDNFIKSCAAYCVITYILGVGDRHLDNLLVTNDGKLFHIDFGYILGNDPKSFPPPMKLCREMVEGMGGAQSKGYERFLSFCCEAYNIFRKSANLIINLFLLMIDANIDDIDKDTNKMSNQSDRYKNIMKVQERFRLDLKDPEAMRFMQGVINDSKRAMFANIYDQVHRYGQYWKK